MFASHNAAARRASAPSSLSSRHSEHVKEEEIRKADDTSPEEPHHEVENEDKNQDEDKISYDIVCGDNNNQEDDEIYHEAPSIAEVLPADFIDLKDIRLDNFEKNPPPLATSWIISWDKRAVWPQALSDACPFIKGSFEFDNHDKVAQAALNYSAILTARQHRARAHNQHVALSRLRRQDAASAIAKAKSQDIVERLDSASERRDLWLAIQSTPLSSNQLPSPELIQDESLREFSQRRITLAQEAREQLLSQRSARSGAAVDRAKAIAADIASLHEQYKELAAQDLQDRLTRASMRRLILLDKRRLIAGRHSNYVKSVYLTNRYMERREAEQLEINMDAAVARRDANIEAIQSNARRHNLSTQFRVSCAFRLFDAKWLNQALRNTSAQQSADLRRDQLLQARLAALQDAASRRFHVMCTRRQQTIEKANLVGAALQKRLDEAAIRRQIHLTMIRQRIVDRRELIRARKIHFAHQFKRYAKWFYLDKVDQAKKRREAWLEHRRSAAATRNWYAKVLAHRQVEARIESSESLALQVQEKLEAAASRRFEYQRPLFSELVNLRGKRVEHVLGAHKQLLTRLSARKAALASIRLAEIDHERATARHAAWLHVQQVKERREHDQVFRQQCIASHAFARLRSAEIRRALGYEAIRVAAEQNRERASAARLRVHIRLHEQKAFMEFRLIRAEEKRAIRRAEKVSPAIWFSSQGEAARNRQLLRQETRRVANQQSLQEAALRKAIALTHRARKHFVERAIVSTRQNCIRIALAEKDIIRDTKFKRADARRMEILAAKQRSAHRTIERVVLARLERQSTDIVDTAIKTAMNATVALQAEARRVQILQSKQRSARERLQVVNANARSQRAKQRVQSAALLEQSQSRLDETTKRREALLAARKVGQSVVERLQPFAGLRVEGKAMTLWPSSA
ncbi:unnamed protein product [Aphanomyces euteiches]